MALSSLFCCFSDNVTKLHSDDETPRVSAVNVQQVPASPVTTKSTLNDVREPTTTRSSSLFKPEPYSPQRSLALFHLYADRDEPQVIGPDGFERLCKDAEMSMDSPLPLIFAWQMNGTQMAKLKMAEWVQGTDTLKISSLTMLTTAMIDLESILIRNQKPLEKSNKKEPYDRSTYWKYAEDTGVAFQKLYTFCFNLVKPPQSRNIDMEVSAAVWGVLLVPKYPIMEEVLEFIKEKPKYKATNKDLWNMMLEFCKSVQPTLNDYEADGAWPTLLDDFVSWKKDKMSNSQATNGDVIGVNH